MEWLKWVGNISLPCNWYTVYYTKKVIADCLTCFCFLFFSHCVVAELWSLVLQVCSWLLSFPELLEMKNWTQISTKQLLTAAKSYISVMCTCLSLQIKLQYFVHHRFSKSSKLRSWIIKILRSHLHSWNLPVLISNINKPSIISNYLK